MDELKLTERDKTAINIYIEVYKYTRKQLAYNLCGEELNNAALKITELYFKDCTPDEFEEFDYD